ncbi:MAG: hypothetical protein WBC07_01000 [Methylotenera sp.]
MTEKQNTYGKLTANDLRILLTFLPMIDKEQAEMIQLVTENYTDIFSEKTPHYYWCNMYEKPYPQHVAEVITALGHQEELSSIANSENPTSKLLEFMKEMDGHPSAKDKTTFTSELNLAEIPLVLALNCSMVFTLRSLMVYGLYLNELLVIIREGKPSERDKAIFQAVRIDPTVIGCPPVLGRISHAVMMNDEVFMNDLQLATFGKFDYQKNKNYQKIRCVLQVLIETGANNLSDVELKELFVKELNIYSDSKFTAEKNLGEFARKFKKKKSTI